MNPITLKALEESIEHWKRLSAGKQRQDERPNCRNCALCSLFNPFADNNLNFDSPCKGCPVFESTNRTFCKETPYTKADLIYEHHGFSKEFKQAAKEELKFLQSLLPAAVKKNNKQKL